MFGYLRMEVRSSGQKVLRRRLIPELHICAWLAVALPDASVEQRQRIMRRGPDMIGHLGTDFFRSRRDPLEGSDSISRPQLS